MYYEICVDNMSTPNPRVRMVELNIIRETKGVILSNNSPSGNNRVPREHFMRVFGRKSQCRILFRQEKEYDLVLAKLILVGYLASLEHEFKGQLKSINKAINIINEL